MKQADVVIVLGAAVWRGGRASPALKNRVARGVALLREGVAPRLMLTGGLGRHPPTEAEVMHDLALAGGADPERLVLERQAKSTYDSARLCAEIMRREGWATAVVVTDGYHLPRSLMAFRGFGVRAVGCASGGGRPGTLGWRRWAGSVARELPALAWYALRLLKARAVTSFTRSTRRSGASR